MTGWQSMFDAGKCVVEARHHSLVMWSGNLAKGESSPEFAGYLNGEMMQIAVDESGVVSLFNASDEHGSDGWTLAVVTQYVAIGAGVRASGITISCDEADEATASTDLDEVTLTPAEGWQSWVPTTVSPDPAEFDGAPGQDPVEIAVFMGAGS